MRLPLPTRGRDGTRPSVRLRSRALVLASLCAAAFALRGAPPIIALNDQIERAEVALLPAPPSADAVVVAIDAPSLQADRTWPWPRDRYAKLVRALDEAGAARVVFDIDFSTPREGDEAFADALAETELPAYAAAFRAEYPGMPGVHAEMVPSELLRPYLLPVTTQYRVDEHGLTRTLDTAVRFSVGEVPALPFALTDGRPGEASVLLDLRRDPGRLPVLGFTSVLNGRADPSVLDGKTVLVGATAPELGDEFALPLRGFYSGVLINAVAYETAATTGFPRRAPDAAILLLAGLAALLTVSFAPSERRGLMTYALVNAAFLACLLTCAILARSANLILPVALPVLAQAGGFAAVTLGSLNVMAQRAFQFRMATRDAAALLASITDRNQEGVAVLGEAGRILSCNDKFEVLVGSRAAGRAIAEVAPRLAQGLAAGDGACDLTFGEGEAACAVEARWSCIEIPREPSRFERRRGDRTKTVVLLHDVTPFVRAREAEAAARREHEAASAAKSTLIMTMSHELRTPLNAIIGFSDLIRDESFGAHASPEYAEFAGLAASGGRRLLHVVDDLLLAARFQSGEVEPIPGEVAMADLRELTMGKLPPAATEAKGRVVWCDDEQRLRVDRDLAAKALAHLVQNALVFGGDEVTVTVTAAREDDAVVLCVADDGPGLVAGAEDRDLFAMFVQGDGSLSRRHDGCGLGLFLVRSFAEAHGGHVAIDASGGFAVTVRLPGAHVGERRRRAA